MAASCWAAPTWLSLPATRPARGTTLSPSPWYATTLGVGYAADSSGTPLVSGVPGDPVGAGLTFSINGNGANALPDVLTAQGGSARPAVRGRRGGCSARRQGADGKSLFLGFDAAGIADNAARSAFMAAALDWLADDASAVPLPGASTPLDLGAFPDPLFSTRVRRCGSPTTARTPPLPRWTCTTSCGRRPVRTLRRGPLAAGRTAVTWDGRDEMRAAPCPPARTWQGCRPARRSHGLLKLTIAK